jgi:hypothetical protein
MKQIGTDIFEDIEPTASGMKPIVCIVKLTSLGPEKGSAKFLY